MVAKARTVLEQQLYLMTSALLNAQQSGTSCPFLWDELEKLTVDFVVMVRAKQARGPMVDEAAATLTEN